MCGLAGRFDPEALPPAPGWAEQASLRLEHRGPDGAGCFRDERCELIHRRLALIDLSPTGQQPMMNEDGSVVLVYNGEVYNHRELRQRLLAGGHAFRGTSDTECLVHLYEEKGERMVEDLRGIFAFALYDVRRRRLLLARDRYGVKPMFYSRHNGQWLFASEMKAILALPGFRPTLDRQACYDFLGMGYVPEPATGFNEISALPRGTVMVITPEGHRQQRYHLTAARPDPAKPLDATVEELERRLLEAVKAQSVADVPVAALLSGGIDSSLVTAAHRTGIGHETTTFNVRFPDPRMDETHVAKRVAEHCGTSHHVIDGGERALDADALLGLFRHFDQPFADTSCIPMYWVSSAIRERGIICALSGDGGDEAFGGYARFWRANSLYAMMSAPAWLRWSMMAAGRSLAPLTRDWGRQLSKAAALAEQGRVDSAPLLAGLSNYLTEAQKDELVAAPARAGLEPNHRLFNHYPVPAVRDLEELSQRITETLFSVSLPSDMLRKVDMMSMKASIEVRVPMLDEAIVDIGLSLPHALKTDGRQGKLVLRRLASRWLPGDVVNHPKHGFSIPLDVMVPASLYEAAGDYLLGGSSRIRGVVNQPLVEGWLGEFAAARAGSQGGEISRGGLYQRVMMLLSMETWMRDHALTW